MRWAVLWLCLLGLVLLPFVLFEAQFNAFAARMTAADASRGAVAASIFGLLAFDVFLPVPSSIVSTAAGLLLGFWQGAAIVWIGMMVGCLVGYAVGSKGSRAAARLVGREGLDRAAGVMRRYGDAAIVLCRPVPVLAEASVVFAGIVRAPFARFAALTAVSNLGIACGYAGIGAFSLRLDSFLLAFLGAILLPALFLGISRLTFSRGRTRGGADFLPPDQPPPRLRRSAGGRRGKAEGGRSGANHLYCV